MTSLAERVAQPDMAGLPEWQVTNLLTAPDQTLPLVSIAVSVADARQLLMASLTPDQTTNAWVAILLVADDVSSPARKPALAIREAIRAASVINMRNPMEAMMVNATLTALVQAAVITAETRDALLALSQRRPSWAEHHQIEVTPRSVSLARRGE